ncbi:hypothetical protein AB0H19_15715 [Streptomyces albogriseolus]
MRLVERGFATRHRVTASADAFGCSLRTLARVVLEAKRLLAHTELPAARGGAAVGFPDAAGVPRGTPLNDGAGTPTRAPRGVRGALVTGRESRVWGVGQAGQEAVSTCT